MAVYRNIAVLLARTAAVAVAVAAAQPAFAQESQVQYAYYPDPALTDYQFPGPPTAVLEIPVKASVGGTCGLQDPLNETIFNPNIDTTGWSDQVAFVPECTAPWRIAVSSQNGAMKNAATVAPGYTNIAPYDVALNLNSDSGVVTGSCPVAQLDAALATSPCTFKGAASSSNGLLVPRSYQLSGSYLQVSAPAYPGPNILVEGMYYDTLVVTVSPAS